MAKALAFGLGRAVPDAAEAAWGARWIWPDDQLYDRQAACGSAAGKAALLAWLNGGACDKARSAARNLAGMELAAPATARGRVTRAKARGGDRPWPRTVPPAGPRWHSSDDDQRELYRDECGVIVGCPNGSYGYLYVAAWLHPTA